MRGGIPSVPIKIVRPDLEVYVLEALNKRVTFLEHLKDVLELEDFFPAHGRAEEIARNGYGNFFDITTARAVAQLPTLLEFCIPLTKVDGLFIALKGSSDEELLDAKNALIELDTNLVVKNDFRLPNNDKRSILVFKKASCTLDKYPRL